MVLVHAELSAAQSVDREVLPNGLTVVVQTMSVNHVVALRLDVGAGSSDEADLLGSGVSRVLQRCLLRAYGGPHVPIEAEVREQSAIYRLRSTDRDVARDLAALAQVVVSGYPRDREAGADTPNELSVNDLFSAERQAHLQEVLDQQDRLEVLSEHWLRRLFYREHPARIAPNGLPGLISQLSSAQAQEYYQTRYTAPNMTLTVVGNVTMAQILPLVHQHFHRVQPGQWLPEAPVVEPRQSAARFKELTAPVAQTSVVRAWRTVALEDRMRPMFDLLAAYLNTPAISPLHRALVDGQLATRVEVVHHSLPGYPGWLAIHYQPIADRATDANTAVAAALQRIAQQGLSGDEVQAARRQVQRQVVRQLSLPSSIADHLATWEWATANPHYGRELHAQLDELDPEQLRQLAATWLHANGRNRCVLHVRPLGSVTTSQTESTEPAPTRSDVAPQQLSDMPAQVTTLVRSLAGERVRLALVMKGGAALAPADKPGLALVHAAILEQGSTNRAGADLKTILATRAIDFRVRVGLHDVVLEASCFPVDLDTALSIIVDPLRQPRLTESALTAALQHGDFERLRIADVASMAQDDSRSVSAWHGLIERSIVKTLLSDHYAFLQGQAVLPGQGPGGEQIDLASLASYHERMVQGNNMHLAVYGVVEEAAVRQRLSAILDIEPRFLAGEAVTISASPWPAESAEEEQAATSIVWDQAQAALGLVWRGPTRDEVFAAGIAVDVLAELLVGANGLVVKGLAAEGIEHSELAMWSEPLVGRGLIHLRAKLAVPDQRLALRAVVKQTLETLRADLAAEDSKLLTEEAFQAATAAIWRRHVLSEEDPAAVVQRHARWSAQGVLAQGLAYPRALTTVSKQEIQTVLDSYLSADPVVIEVVPVRTDLETPEPTLPDSADPEGLTPNPTVPTPAPGTSSTSSSTTATSATTSTTEPANASTNQPETAP